MFLPVRRALAVAALAAVALLALTAASALATPPPNDNFADAATVSFPDTDAEVTAAGDTTGATGQTGEPSPLTHARHDGCHDAGATSGGSPCERSVWYEFTAPRNATVDVNTCELTGGEDTVMGVYTGTDLATLVPVGENDDDDSLCPGSTFASRVRFSAHQGTTYHVLVAGYEANQTGFTLHLRAPSPAAPQVTRTFPSTVNPDATPQTFTIDSEPDTTLTCSLDGAAGQPCDSAYTLPGAGLAEGHHTLTAFAHRDGLTSPAAPAAQWDVDRTPPDTSITSGPADGTSVDQTGDYTAQSTEDGTVECLIDGSLDSSLHYCSTTMPANTDIAVHVAGLCNGPHTLGFRGRDDAGNVDPTPATRSVTVTNSSDCAPPTISDFHHQEIASLAGGTVDVDGHGAGTTGHIEWGTTTAYGHSTPEEDVGLGGPLGDPSKFDDVLMWLDPNTTYHLRFVAHNAAGTTTSGDYAITTPAPSGAAPSLTVDPPSDLSATGVTLHGVVHSSQRAYAAFEYGPTTHYGHYTSVAVFSQPDANLPVVGAISGLQPGTTYHYRLLAGSQGGVARSADGTFTTPGGNGSQPPSQPVTQPQPQLPLLFDRTPPHLSAAGSTTAKLTRSGAIAFYVRSSENATGSATGTVSVPNGAKAYRFKRHSVKLRAGKRTRITLKLTKHDARRVRAALAKHRLRAKITVAVHDKSGNRSTKRIELKLKP